MTTDLQRIDTDTPTKLLIFNVHGTLFDCSLLFDPNPNTSIRMTTKSLTSRFVSMPWLIEFIGRCFENFRVAFWGINSKSYMEEVVVEIMRKFEGLDSHKSNFCRSAKECEEVIVEIGVSM